jgi:hypothetical protein
METIAVCHMQPTACPPHAGSLPVCVQGALRRWGESPPFYCVVGLAGTAFGPSLHPDACCAVCPRDLGGHQQLDLLGHALGFEVERSPLEHKGPAWDEFSLRAQAALGAGETVLCPTWQCWTLVETWRGNPGHLTLIVPPGRRPPFDLSPNTPFCILRRARRSLTLAEAFWEAALVAGSAVPPTEGPSGGGPATGVYSRWVAQLSEQTFCPLGHTDAWDCAERAASRCVADQLAVVQFLQAGIQLSAPARSSSALGCAVQSYLAMADVLTPYATGSGLQTTWHLPLGRQRYRRALERVRELQGEAHTQLRNAV